MYRRHMPVALVATLAGAAAFPATQAAAAASWNVATGYRADGYHAVTLNWLAQAVDAATQGALRWTLWPEGKRVALAQIPQAVVTGQLEAGECIMTSMAGAWPVCGADAIPFMTRHTGDALRLWKVQRPLVEQTFQASGLIALYAVPWPGQGLFTMRPVRSAADLRGMRMRTYNLTTRRIAEMLDAIPVEVAMADVGQALEGGRIDSMITSAVTGVEQQVWRWMHHFYDLNAWMPKNLVMASAPAVRGLDPLHRRALLDLSVEAEQRGWAAAVQAASQSREALVRQGMQVEPTPEHLRGTLVRMGERFAREWVREIGPSANQIFIPYFSQQ